MVPSPRTDHLLPSRFHFPSSSISRLREYRGRGPVALTNAGAISRLCRLHQSTERPMTLDACVVSRTASSCRSVDRAMRISRRVSASTSRVLSALRTSTSWARSIACRISSWAIETNAEAFARPSSRGSPPPPGGSGINRADTGHPSSLRLGTLRASVYRVRYTAGVTPPPLRYFVASTGLPLGGRDLESGFRGTKPMRADAGKVSNLFEDPPDAVQIVRRDANRAFREPLQLR